MGDRRAPGVERGGVERQGVLVEGGEVWLVAGGGGVDWGGRAVGE